LKSKNHQKMRNNILLFFILVIIQIGFSQGIERKVLRGKIVADSLEVENLTVYNITSNVGAITDVDGKFSINARATDTLFIQGLSYDSKRYVLTDKDFWLPVLEIKLHVKITELNEIIITPYTLTGDLKEDTKRIQVYGEGFSKIDMGIKHYEDDVKMGTPINTALPNQFAPTGISFLPLINGLSSLLGVKGDPKKNSERVFEERRIRDLQSKSFSEHMLERFSHNFFVETLKIKNEDIPMFMSFAELNVYELSPLLKAENELKLIEYLINKSEEFKLQKAKE
jgi:hypothetical protein